MSFIKLSFPHLSNAKGRAEAGHWRAVFSVGDLHSSAKTSGLLGNQLTNLTPGDELDVVLLENFAKSVAGEEVEVALAPGCAPVRMIRSCAAHFRIVVREMNHDLGYARLEFA